MGLSGDLGTAAAIINQIDYWIEHNKNDDISNGKKDHFKGGKWWVYNTMSQWQEQFPYEAKKTIERTLRKLEKCGIVETGRYNQKGYDRTKWYTLNYKLIENLMQQERDKLSLSNSTKMSKSKGTNCLDALGQIDRSNTIEYTKKPLLQYTAKMYFFKVMQKVITFALLKTPVYFNIIANKNDFLDKCLQYYTLPFDVIGIFENFFDLIKNLTCFFIA